MSVHEPQWPRWPGERGTRKLAEFGRLRFIVDLSKNLALLSSLENRSTSIQDPAAAPVPWSERTVYVGHWGGVLADCGLRDAGRACERASIVLGRGGVLYST